MGEALDGHESGISVGSRKINNLRCADDTTLIADAEEDLCDLITWVKAASEKAGLYLNISKTKVMTTEKLQQVHVNGDDIG